MILATLTYGAFQTTNRHKSLDTDALKVLNQLKQARSLTLAAKNADQWGVHLATSSVTLFEGASYDAGDSSNVIVPMHPLVTISNIDLAGGGSEVIFDRLTGETAHAGTTTLSLVASSTVQRTLVIYRTGVVEMQ